MQFVWVFFYICRKFELLISQGSIVTCLRWGGYCSMDFVANFIRFLTVNTFCRSVTIWQSYGQFKGGNLFETQCIVGVIKVEVNKSLECFRRLSTDDWWPDIYRTRTRIQNVGFLSESFLHRLPLHVPCTVSPAGIRWWSKVSSFVNVWRQNS